MSQHDFDVANDTFPNLRADLNLALKALASLSSGPAAPATMYANQLWYEDDTNTLWIRNETNTGWIALMVLDQAGSTWSIPAMPFLLADGSAGAPGLSWSSDTDTGIFRPGNNILGFSAAGAEVARFNSSGNLLIGHTAALSGFTGPRFQSAALTVANANWVNSIFASSINSATMAFAKSRGATVGDYTIVQSGDTLGTIEFNGSDGSTFVAGAKIRSQVVGTPASNDIRASLIFATASAAGGGQTTRLTIDDTTVDATLPIKSSGPISSGFQAHAAGTLAMALATKPNCSVTPNATGTLTTTVPSAGTICTIEINTSGTTSYTMTFGSGFKASGTLATGTVTGKTFLWTGMSNGTTVNEISRTVAM